MHHLTSLDLRFPSDDPSAIDDILSFAAQWPSSSLDTVTIRSLLELIRRYDRRQLVEVWPEGERALVACLMAGIGSPDDRAELFILGRKPGVRVDTDALLQHAEALVREPSLELTLTPPLDDFRTTLERRGFALAYDNVAMTLPDLASAVARSAPIPAGTTWVELDDASVQAGYECFLAAFAGVEGAHTPKFDEFCRIVFEAVRRPRGLMSGGRCVAFARVVWRDEPSGVGEVRLVCRDPAHRARGLGRLAVDEALQMLAGMGASSAWLEVVSTNSVAVGLYQRCGFRETARCAVYRKDLRSNSALARSSV